MNLLQVVPQTGALASSAQETQGQGGSLLSMGSARHILLMRPGVWLGGREPPLPQQICKRGQRCPLRNLELHG